MKISLLSFFIIFVSFLGCSGDKNSTKNTPSLYNIYEDAEDQTIIKWLVRNGSSEDAKIRNVYDANKKSRVIEFQGNGTRDAYIFGAERGQKAWGEKRHKMISWEMQFSEDVVVYVMVDTIDGIRYLFYTPSYVRGLLHGFERGIMHGLGDKISDGRWRRITRDLESDLKDAEPNNKLVSVNGVIVRGSGRIDNLILYTPTIEKYDDGEQRRGEWKIVDNEPSGAAIERGLDNIQGYYTIFRGEGIDNAYMLGSNGGEDSWKNRKDSIFQWRFKAFGNAPEVIEEPGVIRNKKAFEFRVFVDTKRGARELVYTLGLSHLGVIKEGVIHHALGDDRTIGSVLLGSNNLLGLWQTVTRDLEEDIKDFEPDNRLIEVNGFQVRGSGFVDDIQLFNSIN